MTENERGGFSLRTLYLLVFFILTVSWSFIKADTGVE